MASLIEVCKIRQLGEEIVKGFAKDLRKGGDLQFKAVWSKAEFCTWRFFQLAYRPLVGATVIYMRANLLHINVFKIRNIVSGELLG